VIFAITNLYELIAVGNRDWILRCWIFSIFGDTSL